MKQVDALFAKEGCLPPKVGALDEHTEEIMCPNLIQSYNLQLVHKEKSNTFCIITS